MRLVSVSSQRSTNPDGRTRRLISAIARTTAASVRCCRTVNVKTTSKALSVSGSSLRLLTWRTSMFGADGAPLQQIPAASQNP